MLTLVIGGARNGKSRFAESLCLHWLKVAYIATARANDEEFSLLATGQFTPSFSVIFGTVLTSNYLDPVYNSTTYASQVFWFADNAKRSSVPTTVDRSGSHALFASSSM